MHVEICEAVKDHLNANKATYGFTVDAIRRNQDIFDLTELVEMRVVVFPGIRTLRLSARTRGAAPKAYQVFVAVYEVLPQVEAAKLTREDQLIAIVEAIEDDLTNTSRNMAQAVLDSSIDQDVAPMLPDESQETNVFASIIPLTYFYHADQG